MDLVKNLIWHKAKLIPPSLVIRPIIIIFIIIIICIVISCEIMTQIGPNSAPKLQQKAGFYSVPQIQN